MRKSKHRGNSHSLSAEVQSSIFEYNEYEEFVRDRIQFAKSTQGSGVTRRLSEQLQCHTTFVSQVINKKAGFSVEQALRFSKFFRLNRAETDFFVDLVGLGRAGDESAKVFFQLRIEKLRSKHADLKERWSSRNSDLHENELTYFGSWMIQAVHGTLQLKTCRTSERIASYLGISKIEVEEVLNKLLSMKLVTRTGSEWSTTTHFLHLGKESPLIRQFHLQWRQRVCQEFLKSRNPDSTHYSGILTFARSDESAVRGVLLEALDKIMKIIESSPSEEAFGLNLDFFSLKL